ncbi:ABC transporter permease [Solihabitans fulvus]|uniref:ABC transporter permease n=1 Tax=Solihabitans fulvus TaxID=1892852 RepID=A0A5B2XH93_9PSEU|nr:ABC transporter permease [Solihabitans fulvus]KAA2262162.1 ABC transporter permease [Solihabitans fulvus]
MVPDAPSTRSWGRAFADIRQGFADRELWGHLGWQDIKQRYRRSVIGPLWITISMGVTALGLGLLYAVIFNNDFATFLPYVAVGFIVWGFINGCLTEGMETFIANEGLIKHLPAPLTVYALRTVWRQTLMLAHNLVVYVILLIVFYGDLSKPAYTLSGKLCGTEGAGFCHPGLGWGALMAIPAFVLIAINGGWVTLLFGIISTRFRDIPQVINSLTQLLFYMTPIVWSADTLFAGTHPNRDWAKVLFQFNPLYHFVQIMRAPMVGQQVSMVSWSVVGGITVVGWALALGALRNYRARVSYWV